jgi:recombination protein RecR
MLPQSIQDLAQKLQYFPGFGSRSSQKLALDVMYLADEKYTELVGALESARKNTSFCQICGFFSQRGSICSICSDDSRNHHQICIVEKPTDVLSMEKSQIFRGRYHVLNQLISPLDGIFAESTRLGELFDVRIPDSLLGKTKEVECILFFKAGFSSEATTAYIREMIARRGYIDSVKMTRLAQGLPLYYNTDTLDQATMVRALEDRREVV